MKDVPCYLKLIHGYECSPSRLKQFRSLKNNGIWWLVDKQPPRRCWWGEANGWRERGCEVSKDLVWNCDHWDLVTIFGHPCYLPKLVRLPVRQQSGTDYSSNYHLRCMILFLAIWVSVYIVYITKHCKLIYWTTWKILSGQLEGWPATWPGTVVVVTVGHNRPGLPCHGDSKPWM